MNGNKIRAALLKSNCDWVEFRANEPKASHFGGILESQIRTVKCSEWRNAKERYLLRPWVKPYIGGNLCSFSSYPKPSSDYEDSSNFNPPGIFQTKEEYLKKRWGRIQHFANKFWSRWRKELRYHYRYHHRHLYNNHHNHYTCDFFCLTCSEI